MNYPILIFDEDCNLCNGIIKFIIQHNKTIYFTSMQSELGKKLVNSYQQLDSLNKTIVFIEKNNIYFRSDAVIQICKRLDGFWSFFYYFMFIPKSIRDFLYTIISKNRYKWFGKKKCDLTSNSIVFNRII